MKRTIYALAATAFLAASISCLAACAGGSEFSINCSSSENGTVILADTRAEAGERVILAARPNAGYKTVGYLVNGESVDGSSFIMPSNDVTISARFEIITYSVTYVTEDGVTAGNNPSTYTVENAPELENPNKDGFEVCGWYAYRAEDGKGDIEEYRVTSLSGRIGNLTLYAVCYNPPHEIIIGESEHGYCYAEKYEAAYGDEVELKFEPESGYEPYYAEVNGEEIVGESFIMPPCDATVTVLFRPVEYEITYVLDGGENAPDNPSSYTVETGEIVLHEPYKEGHCFVGWFFDGEYTEYAAYIYSYDYLRPLTLYAKFEKDEGGEYAE